MVDWLKCRFTSTETVGLLGTGAQDSHLDFHTAPELWFKKKKKSFKYHNRRYLLHVPVATPGLCRFRENGFGLGSFQNVILYF